MAASISASLDFSPTARALTEILDELDDLGAMGGGAVDARSRRSALARYASFERDAVRYPRRWRHDYAAMRFEDLQWSTGRALVPEMPRYDGRKTRDDGSDPPALAVENAGGLVHLGSTYLQAPQPSRDARITLASLADAQRTNENVRAIHQQIVLPQADRFTALATAFQNCGAYIDVPHGVVLDVPLQLVWASRPGIASAVFSHTVIRIGANARATVIERHLGQTESFACGTVEIDEAALFYVQSRGIARGTAARMLVSRLISSMTTTASLWYHESCLASLCRRFAFDPKIDVS